ncbi:MAG: hypothetical protein WDW36_007147 [Sanguina aurantia]
MSTCWAVTHSWISSYKSTCVPSNNALYYFTKFGNTTATGTLNRGTVVSFPDSQSMHITNPILQSKLPWTNNGNTSALCKHSKPGGIYFIMAIYNKNTVNTNGVYPNCNNDLLAENAYFNFTLSCDCPSPSPSPGRHARGPYAPPSPSIFQPALSPPALSTPFPSPFPSAPTPAIPAPPMPFGIETCGCLAPAPVCVAGANLTAADAAAANSAALAARAAAESACTASAASAAAAAQAVFADLVSNATDLITNAGSTVSIHVLQPLRRV